MGGPDATETLGHLTCENLFPDMTYIVFGETLDMLFLSAECTDFNLLHTKVVTLCRMVFLICNYSNIAHCMMCSLVPMFVVLYIYCIVIQIAYRKLIAM